jgi:hypothetical protein
MKDDFVECLELAGKTIQTLRVFKDTGDGNEVQIELTDGTSFNLCFAAKMTIEASVLRAGIGSPETLHTYNFD